MRSIVTSYAALFDDHGEGVPRIETLEVPLIQRDYAQGRQDELAERVRRVFLDALHTALTGEETLSLDFVYGEVTNGSLNLLDGQQRMTTLFLLHWYLACRTGQDVVSQPWARFFYATRPSARLFCERLVARGSVPEHGGLAEWITDQAWYLHTWRHDPTVQSMLAMLDAIQERFAEADADRAWTRLVDRVEPAITFHLLPVDDMGSADELYIKMNSRGKPLTPFENFKARLEKAVEGSPRAEELAHRIDGRWSDVMWRFRGDDDIVDDEFMRFFGFVTELCEWRAGRNVAGPVEDRALTAFAHDGARAGENLDFLMHSLDTWSGVDVADFFHRLFATEDPPSPSPALDDRVRLFGNDAASRANLFEWCCRAWGEVHGKQRRFDLSDSILLFSVLLHREHASEDFPRRLRLLRNLTEASVNELRADNMPRLVREVEQIVLTGSLEGVTGFNQAQVGDERRKRTLLETHPELESVVHGLEDHPVLRGSLVAFPLDADRLGARSGAFHALMADSDTWLDLTAGMLAVGDYSRRRDDYSRQLGSPVASRWWRTLLTGTSRKNLATTRKVLAKTLDETVEATDASPRETLQRLRASYIDRMDQGAWHDWRYYLVKYDTMRAGDSGIYVNATPGMGFDVCMLDKTQLNSLYRDPFLGAVIAESGADWAVADASSGPRFSGYATRERWLSMKRSGAGLRVAPDGFSLRPPQAPEDAERWESVCRAHDVGEDLLLRVRQQRPGVDAQDRVALGASFLRTCAERGL